MLKTVKRDIFATVWQILTKFDAMMQIGHSSLAKYKQNEKNNNPQIK